MSMKNSGKIILFAVAALCAALSITAITRFARFVRLASGSDSALAGISIAAGELPATLTLYGRGTDTLSMRLRFLNPSGELLGAMERSWNGWELTIDTIVVGTGSGWLVFPFRAFTDAGTSGSGLDLTKYYNRSGFPALWDESTLSRAETKALRALFAIVLTERWIPSVFGSLHHERLTVRNFEAGAEYTLSVLSDGSLRLLKN